MSNSIPIGARVHHIGFRYSVSFSDNECKGNPSPGWGTVTQVVPQRDGTYEYEILRDAPLTQGGDRRCWWASYQIDRWETIS